MNYPAATEQPRPQRRATDFTTPEQKYNRSSANSQLSLSPGHWKKYIVHDDLVRKPNNRSINEARSFGSPQKLETSNYQIENSNYKAQNARKDEMMRRVKEIQNRVMPILKADSHRRAEDEDFTWHNKIEQRILKLETNLDSIQKEMQIQIEKRVLQVQAKWEQRFQQLLRNTHGYADNSSSHQSRRTEPQPDDSEDTDQ